MERVSIYWDKAAQTYPARPPFAPSELFPEYPYPLDEIDPGNRVYSMVRAALAQLGLDGSNFGSKDWNPLGEFAKPGQKIVIKPNLVKHYHPLGKAGVEAMITHASVLRPLIDYALKAVGKGGEVIIADTPLEKTDFARVLEWNGIASMLESMKSRYGVEIPCRDLRSQRLTVDKADRARVTPLRGDPLGSVVSRLDRYSEFHRLDGEKQNYYTLGDHAVDHFDPEETAEGAPNRFHGPNKHEYVICKTILAADLVINVPKLKTHKKAGITASMKNFVGIAPNKESVPHHRPGAPPRGDAFPHPPPEAFVRQRRFRRNVARIPLVGMAAFNLARFVIRNALQIPPPKRTPIEWGDWHGNDTLWRTIVDLNKIAHYADPQGRLCREPQRKIFCLVDGIIAMEGNGPMEGDPKPCGLIVAGRSPLAVDAACANIMGFNPRRIPTIANSLALTDFPLGLSSLDEIETFCAPDGHTPHFHFRPPDGWKDYVEF